MSTIIKSVTVVVPEGASSHYVGGQSNGLLVSEIKEEDVLIDGNPYLHYIGRTVNGFMCFKISAICPVEVIYSPQPSTP